MANPKNRQAVEETLRTELDRDRTKTFVVEISPLGLVEMTRQNVTDGPREVMTRRCPTCAGDGIVVSDATVALEVERKLRALAASGAGSRIQAYKVAVHPRALALLAGAGGARLAALEEATRRRFYLVPATGHAHVDHFEVLAEGRRDDLAPPDTLDEGTELELKLVEIDLHDGKAAVGRHEGLDVVVADAAKLVGKKAKVVIGRVLEGQAFATLVSGAAPAAPITFESEAEKPTRAPARRKTGEAGEPGEAGEAGEPGEPDAAVEAAMDDEATEPNEVEAVDEAEDDEPEAEALGEDGQPAPARKRTRRGSRGGRRRKKPAGATADADATEGGVAEAETDESEPDAGPTTNDDVEPAAAAPAVRPPARRRTPKIHVPEDARGAETVDATDDAPAAEVAVAPEEAPADEHAPSEGDGDGEQAPTPKKRTRRGTRGGRNRKRKPAAANGDAVADSTDGDDLPEDLDEVPEAVDGVPVDLDSVPEAPAEEPAAETVEPVADEVAAVVASDGDSEAEGYVPMSEWIGDFDRRG
jgi:ribonuclease G